MRNLTTWVVIVVVIVGAGVFGINEVSAQGLFETVPPAPAANAPPPVAPAQQALPSGSAGASSGYGDKRLAIKVLADCPSDPDPLGLGSSDYYSSCDQDELDKVKSWIAAALMVKGVFGRIGDDNPDLVLTVTLTQSGSFAGVAGAVTDMAPSTMKYTANYQLSDVGGRPLASGKVHHEEEEAYFGGNEDEAEQHFAEKIATDLVENIAAPAPSPAATAPSVSSATASKPSP